jgi:uncharacterized protein (TIGR00369 family)
VDSQAGDAMTKNHTHTVTWEEATYPPEWMQLPGLERLQKALAAGIPRAPIAALIDMKLVSVEAGVAHFDAWPGPQHVNPIGIVHGGFAATLMDAACWTAGQTTMGPGEVPTTLELKVSYIRAIMATSPEVKCEARVIHRGGRTVLTEAKVFDRDTKLLAHATSTLLVLKT